MQSHNITNKLKTSVSHQTMVNFTEKEIQHLMPQLVPFYFINQVTFAFILLVAMIYILSKYILPRFVRLFLSRLFISKL